MSLPPRSQKEPLLSRKLLVRAMLWYGMIESAVCMAAYFLFNHLQGWPAVPLAGEGILYRMATTMTFAAIVMCQVAVVFAARTERISVFKIGIFSNRLIIVGIIVELTLLCLLMYSPVNVVFNMAPLGLREWGYLIIIPPVVLLVDELRKYFVRKRGKKISHKA